MSLQSKSKVMRTQQIQLVKTSQKKVLPIINNKTAFFQPKTKILFTFELASACDVMIICD